MNARVLTPAEQAYVRILGRRQLDLHKKIKEMSHRPMTDVHETGLPTWHILVMCIEAAGWTELEMCEALA